MLRKPSPRTFDKKMVNFFLKSNHLIKQKIIKKRCQKASNRALSGDRHPKMALKSLDEHILTKRMIQKRNRMVSSENRKQPHPKHKV
jgi:hypothetical protein